MNAKDEGGMTALMYSVWGDTPNVEIVGTLLDAGAEVGMKDHEGKRAIDHAQANDRIKGTDTLKRLENAISPYSCSGEPFRFDQRTPPILRLLRRKAV